MGLGEMDVTSGWLLAVRNQLTVVWLQQIQREHHLTKDSMHQPVLLGAALKIELNFPTIKVTEKSPAILTDP